MAHPSIANNTLPSSPEQIKRRETFIVLQNNVCSLEHRVRRLCENVYFEIQVKHRQQGADVKQYVLEFNEKMLSTDNKEDLLKENIAHPLQKRIYRLKRLQEEYKALRNIAMDTFAKVKEEHKDEDFDVFIFERKKRLDDPSDSESGLASDTESASEDESDSEFDSQDETDFEFESESESDLFSNHSSDTDTATESEWISDSDSDETDEEYKPKITVQPLKPSQPSFDTLITKPNQTISKFKPKSMKYKSAAEFTKRLLELVFGEEVLSTHTLSSRSKCEELWNPYTKPQLNPTKIAYIIHQICSSFEITPKRVRMIISTKCADAEKKHKELMRKYAELMSYV